LFLQNDTIFITFHINDTVEKLGRKMISGDVIELPHLKDEHALNDLNFALKRFYVIEDVNRAAEGFSVTWYPHLYRAKCKPLVDSQEFKEILDGLADEDSDTTLREIVSTYEKEMQITQAVLNQAEADVPTSGRDVTKFYSLNLGEDGKPQIVSVDTEDVTVDMQTQATDEDGNPVLDDDGNPVYVGLNAAAVLKSAETSGYDGYLYSGDGVPPNGAPFTAGISFPLNPAEGEFCLRKDYKPFRLFRFSGKRWIKIEDKVRMTMSNLGDSDVGEGDRFEGKQVRNNLKSTFINNPVVSEINGHRTKEKQSLSKALRPEADE
jgi:hypothetical protein